MGGHFTITLRRKTNFTFHANKPYIEPMMFFTITLSLKPGFTFHDVPNFKIKLGLKSNFTITLRQKRPFTFHKIKARPNKKKEVCFGLPCRRK